MLVGCSGQFPITVYESKTTNLGEDRIIMMAIGKKDKTINTGVNTVANKTLSRPV